MNSWSKQRTLSVLTLIILQKLLNYWEFNDIKNSHAAAFLFHQMQVECENMANLRRELYAWRDNEAAKRGVELFRVLPNNALDEIVRSLPRTKDELIAIKGIKEAKFREYGQAILHMIEEYKHLAVLPPSVYQGVSKAADEKAVFTVSTYLDIVNRELSRLSARVRGAVTSFKFQGNALYMGIKDPEDESVLSVFMWNADFVTAGITLLQGMEVLVEGRSEIYKPSGRFNFRAHTIELVGEGALKKAYDLLKKKLDAEELFALERKKPLPEYPERIGLITSKTGAVIHDFCNNLGKYGYHISFYDSRVEGQAAVKDLLAAIRHFKNEPIEALVIVRGGGSLESLQAFNNEHVVRAIAEFPKPTIVAIGHDKDVPLAQLVADAAPSTPTACTILLNHSWDEGRHTVRHFSRDILNLCREELWANKERLGTLNDVVRAAFAEITMRFSVASREFSEALLLLGR